MLLMLSSNGLSVRWLVFFGGTTMMIWHQDGVEKMGMLLMLMLMLMLMLIWI